MKKSITLIAGSEQTRSALVKQLKEYLSDRIFINSYATEAGIDEIIRDDLVILSSEAVKNDLLELKLLDTTCEIVTAQRTVSYDFIDKIVLLSPDTEVLLVNDDPESTYESIEILKRIGIDYLKYIPYYPGIKESFKKVNIAITPGEVDKVPGFVEEIYDIGTRIMDFTTITKILSRLDILNEKAGIFSQKYLEKIINVAKRLAKSRNEILELNNHLHLVMDGLNDGLLVYSKNGNVSVLNENLKKLLKLGYRKAIGKSVNNVIYNKNLLSFLMDKNICEGKIFNINGVEVFVNKLYLIQDDSVIAVFKGVKETIETNEKLRRELINKGFYAKYTFEDIVGESESIKRVKAIAKKLAISGLTILIEGESGTGKELFASAIHRESKIRKGPFLAVNFSALPDELIESELFGYEEGAFTGAKKGGKAGLFEQADGGTIFLDEIGDISLKVQARLLRVLQEKEVMRIGGTEIKPINVRIIAATNKDLVKMVREKKFREDLYYRLKMGYIQLPPLRERKMDISNLMDYFIEVGTTEDIKISHDAMNQLLKYDWHGNVRELKNTLTYMLAVREGKYLTLKDIPDKGFFHDIIHNENNGESKNIDIHLNEEQIYILQQIDIFSRKGQIVGREKLSEGTIGTKYEMTKYQMRNRLEQLEKMGLIIKNKGKHGTRLSPKGEVLLKGLMVHNGV
ncbi:sigma 54-interacting transcriptional regulator [Anaeromicrobium sediminis]|uniref:Fis family transcriptional regulator n=1 Tax=Anaeromicrobium sediminis TaxID=1478221 RepID=A0A267MKA1_9FIRM|nr:sigma 54-interacting transcriptional regulator [Anaeromicrobium sediminis]PAB60014.1 Fis family transcriptional regulator [Anaeromicrobium sediminis]